MFVIRKKDPRYKEWKRRNDERKFIRNYISKQKKKKRRKNKVLNNTTRRPRNKQEPDKVFLVPTVFSIIDNPEQTISFLNDMIKEVEKIRRLYKVNKHNYIRLFSIKMDHTTQITGDALMYLLTIIKNTRGRKILPINWVGTFPKDNNMKQFLKNSGYLNYMKTAEENLIHTNNHIQIQTGYGYEYQEGNEMVDIRQKIIDFSCEKMNKNKTQLNYLMTMLTEMITNIKDHAYDTTNIFEPSWYIFVENNPCELIYTFMDNGLGIPTTIKKKIIELLKSSFSLDKEYKYIEAGVSGLEKRSQTGKTERGNGLPSIYEQYRNNKVDRLVIISNKAYFETENSRDLKNELHGTIFYWKIKKEGSA